VFVGLVNWWCGYHCFGRSVKHSHLIRVAWMAWPGPEKLLEDFPLPLFRLSSLTFDPSSNVFSIRGTWFSQKFIENFIGSRLCLGFNLLKTMWEIIRFIWRGCVWFRCLFQLLHRFNLSLVASLLYILFILKINKIYNSEATSARLIN